MRFSISIKKQGLASVSLNLFKKIGEHKSFLWGNKMPCLWRMPWVSKPGRTLCLCTLCFLCAVDSSDSPLVQHLLTFWWSVLHPSLFYPCTCAQTSIVGTRSWDQKCGIMCTLTVWATRLESISIKEMSARLFIWIASLGNWEGLPLKCLRKNLS